MAAAICTAVSKLAGPQRPAARRPMLTGPAQLPLAAPAAARQSAAARKLAIEPRPPALCGATSKAPQEGGTSSGTAPDGNGMDQEVEEAHATLRRLPFRLLATLFIGTFMSGSALLFSCIPFFRAQLFAPCVALTFLLTRPQRTFSLSPFHLLLIYWGHKPLLAAPPAPRLVAAPRSLALEPRPRGLCCAASSPQHEGGAPSGMPLDGGSTDGELKEAYATLHLLPYCVLGTLLVGAAITLLKLLIGRLAPASPLVLPFVTVTFLGPDPTISGGLPLAPLHIALVWWAHEVLEKLYAAHGALHDVVGDRWWRWRQGWRQRKP
ncbi:hypothetical protein ABPG75_004971 [Micractinium tetrahymenae]